MKNESLVFLAGKRTPFGTNGGALRDVHPVEMTVVAGKAALEQAHIEPKDIDHVIVGNVLHSVADSIYTPRHTGLKLGVPIAAPSLGINRLCGSGFQVIVDAYHQFLAGDSRIALVGGVENMSLAPYVLRGARWGMKMGNAPLSDLLMDSLFDTYTSAPMAMTAEKLGAKYGITRDQVDEFSFQSQSRCKAAMSAGRFRDEIASMTLQDKKGKSLVVQSDEHPRPETTLEKLKGLKSLFQKDGLVTAGNASGIVDGAAMMVVSTEDEAKKRKLTPLGRMVSYGIAGCEPDIMGYGPVPATHQALKKAGMSLGQMDLIEINEAFAAQTLAVVKELEVPQEILNVNGGAIAIGHPLAASGTRIIQTLLYELKRRNKKFGLGTACIGGGQGISVIVEAY